MKIKSAKYETVRGLPVLRIEFSDSKPDGIVLAEDAYRWAFRDWPGVYLGSALEDVILPASIDGRQFRGVSTDPDVLKLAKKFYADWDGGKWEDKTLDVRAILEAE